MFKRLFNLFNQGFVLDDERGVEKSIKIKKKKTGKSKQKTIKKNKAQRKIEFLRVFTLSNEAHLIYKKSNSFYIRSLNGKGFYKKDRKISIKSNFGYDVTKKDLIDINLGDLNGRLILSYKRQYNKNQFAIFADSLDGVNFKERAVSKTIKGRIIFAQNNFSKDSLEVFVGENFIYLASAESLNKWVLHREHILTPRQRFFDCDGLKLVESLDLNEGVFLLYESSFFQDDKFYFQLGGALFEKNNLRNIIWRSERPIWEQSFPAQEIKSGACLGAYKVGKKINAYFEINNDLTMVDFGIPKFDLKMDSSVIKRHDDNPIIKPKKENKWESKASFNAAAIYAEDRFHLIYRAIGEEDVSTWGYASSGDGFNFDLRLKSPIYIPRERFEGVLDKKYKPCGDLAVYESGGGCSGGCEDPRLTKIDNTIYITYVAYNGHDVPGVAISSIEYDDFVNHRWNWSKARLISKPGQIQKNWMLFPEKINGKFAIIHSITPKIMIDYFDDINDDKVYIEKSFRKTDTNENRWDNIVRGAGAPPIRTKYGWLLLYHAMDKRDPNRYKIGAMILDFKDPETIIYRSRLPILEPDEIYENEGMKAGVIYVCGVVVEKGILYIYYGGADMVMCVATAKLDDFLERLTADKKTFLKKIKL